MCIADQFNLRTWCPGGVRFCFVALLAVHVSLHCPAAVGGFPALLMRFGHVRAGCGGRQTALGTAEKLSQVIEEAASGSSYGA
jgi:hypothetical protein